MLSVGGQEVMGRGSNEEEVCVVCWFVISEGRSWWPIGVCMCTYMHVYM